MSSSFVKVLIQDRSKQRRKSILVQCAQTSVPGLVLTPVFSWSSSDDWPVIRSSGYNLTHLMSGLSLAQNIPNLKVGNLLARIWEGVGNAYGLHIGTTSAITIRNTIYDDWIRKWSKLFYPRKRF